MADGRREKLSRVVQVIKEAADTATPGGAYQGAAYFSYESRRIS